MSGSDTSSVSSEGDNSRCNGPPPLPPLGSHTLQLSTLLWEWRGGPTDVIYDTEPALMGTYAAGPGGRIALDLDAPWSPDHAAFVYRLPEMAPVRLRYTRRTFVGNQSSEITYYGGIISFQDECSGQTIGPKLRIHDIHESAFPDTLPQLAYAPSAGRGPGPPFDLYNQDRLAGGDSDASTIGCEGFALNVDAQDLPGQGWNDTDLHVLSHSDDERVCVDDYEWLGWQGDWLAGLLQKRARDQDMGTRTEIKWCAGKIWGVELQFMVSIHLNVQEPCRWISTATGSHGIRS